MYTEVYELSNNMEESKFAEVSNLVKFFPAGVEAVLFLLVNLRNIAFLTFGVWTTEVEHCYGVSELAVVYDDDDDDDDNQQELILSIIGRSRGTFWMIIPGFAAGKSP